VKKFKLISIIIAFATLSLVGLALEPNQGEILATGVIIPQGPDLSYTGTMLTLGNVLINTPVSKSQSGTLTTTNALTDSTTYNITVYGSNADVWCGITQVVVTPTVGTAQTLTVGPTGQGAAGAATVWSGQTGNQSFPFSVGINNQTFTQSGSVTGTLVFTATYQIVG